MSVSTINIKDKNGNVLKSVSNALVLSPSLGAGVAFALKDKNKIVLNMTSTKNVYEKALEQIKTLPYLTRISTVLPDSDGCVWIHGDACSSWDLDRDETYTYESTNDAGETIYNSEKGGGITLYDMCPACDDCNVTLRIKKLYEWCKLALNTLKDVNLYDISACSTRREYMEGLRIPTQTNCDVSDNSLMTLDTKQLLGQYTTIVHMWNYIVSKMNTSTDIEAAEEDPCGFYITTKKVVPSCAGKSNVQCQIDVSLRSTSIPVSDVSIYVPDPILKFEPFSSNVSDSDFILKANSATSKTIITTFKPVITAGTYIVTAKFLPFKCVVLTDANGHDMDVPAPYTDTVIKREVLDEYSVEVGDTWYKETIKTGVTTVHKVVINPTAADYDKGRAYPSKTVDGVTIWDIAVKWTWSGATETAQVTEEHYVFQTSAMREYLDGMFNDCVRYVPADTSYVK